MTECHFTHLDTEPVACPHCHRNETDCDCSPLDTYIDSSMRQADMVNRILDAVFPSSQSAPARGTNTRGTGV